jgi:predicted nucleic acid-binding protein
MLLDTNVISELLRPAPSPAVLSWLREPRALYLSAVTRTELLLGVALPAGRRRTRLDALLHETFDERFAGRCLPFDSAAADFCAFLRAHRLRAGLPISTEDAQLAAIALAQELPLVTRNTRDFRGIPGLEVINPWLDD